MESDNLVGFVMSEIYLMQFVIVFIVSYHTIHANCATPKFKCFPKLVLSSFTDESKKVPDMRFDMRLVLSCNESKFAPSSVRFQVL